MQRSTHPAKHSETLARGMASGTLREVEDRVTAQSARLQKTLRRKASAPITLKGARKLMSSINRELAPISIASISINSVQEKTLTTAWLLPHVLNKQLQLASHIVKQNKRDGITADVSPSVVFSVHALARLMQRDISLDNIEWLTLRRVLRPPVSFLWPVLLAHRSVEHKQFALPASNGLFVGSFEAGTNMPIVRTFIAEAGMSARWRMVMSALHQLGHITVEMCNDPTPMLPEASALQERVQFAINCNAVGLGTPTMANLTSIYEQAMRNPEFDWMREERDD